MTNNKRFIVLLTAIMAVGLLSTFTFGASLVKPTAPVTAGNLLQITFDADAYNATAPITITSDQDGQLYSTSADAAGLSTTMTVWTEAPVTTAADHSITVSDGTTSNTLSGGAVTVVAADPVSYSLTDPGSETAGSSFNLDVGVVDEYGNVTSYDETGALEVYSDLGGVIGSADAPTVNDSFTVNATATTAGTHSIHVEGGLGSSSSISVDVSAAAPATMSIAPKKDPIESGESLQLNITGIQDEYGNTVDSGTLNTLSVYSSKDGDLGLSGATPSISGGEATTTISAGSSNLVSVGSHTITAYNTNISSVTTTVQVDPIATTITVGDKLPTSSGDTFNPSATLDTTGGVVPNGGTVTFSYSDQSDITGTIGGGSGDVTGGSDFTEDGTTSYSASFAQQTIGGLVYGSSSGSAVVEVEGSGTTLSIDSGATIQKAGTAFDVTASFNQSIEGATLNFSIEGGSSTTATTDATGSATATLTPSEAGTKTIKVSFAGGTIDGTFYGNDQVTSNITVNPGPLATVTIEKVENASNLAADEPIETGNKVALVDVLLQDVEGNPLNSISEGDIDSLTAETNAQAPSGLTLVDNGTTGYGISSEGYLTDNGSASIVISEGQMTAIATHIVTLYVSEGGVTKTGQTTIEVTKRRSRFVSEAAPTVTVGSDFDLSATLQVLGSGGSSWQDYGSVDVSFSFQGTTITDATDGSGVADTTDKTDQQFTAPSTPGKYDYTVKFTGDGTAESVTKTGTVTVEPGSVASIEVTAVPDNVKSGTSFDVTLVGKDSDGNLVTSTAIEDFKVVSNQDGQIFDPSDVLLDGNGEATISVGIVSTTGTHDLTFYDTTGQFSTTASTNVVTGTGINIQEPAASALEFSEDFKVEAYIYEGSSAGTPVTGVDVTLKLWNDPDTNSGVTNNSLPTGTVSDDTLIDSATVTVTSENDAGTAGVASATFTAPYDDLSHLYLTAEFAGDSTYYESADSDDSNLAMASAVTDYLNVTPAISGWHMVSVEGVPASPTPSTLFGTNSSAFFYWNGTSYKQGDNVGDISPVKGYWFYASSSVAGADITDSTNDDGFVVSGDVEVPLASAGWHMISSPFTVSWGDVKISKDGGDTWVSVDQAQSNLWMSKLLYAYDTENNTYTIAEAPSGQIVAGKGYWIKTDVADLLLGLPFTPEGPGVLSASLSEMGFEPVPEGAELPPAPPSMNQAGQLKATAAVSSEGVTFEVSGADVQSINVQVFDLDGGQVFSSSASGNSLSWNANVSNGIYLYGVSAEVNGELKPLGIQKLLILQ